MGMKYYIGIDLGGMSAKAGILDENGVLRLKKRCETRATDTPEKTAWDLAGLALEIMGEYGLERTDVGGVGIGSPGIIDSRRGVVVNWSNFGWLDVPLAELVSSHLGIPVYVANDANAAALGEARFGSGKSYADSVMITLGTGVGGGIVMDGKLVEGYRSAGGELGHTVIRQGGIKCTCGRRGCLERYASASALTRMSAEAMVRHRDSLMWDESRTLEEVSGKTAFIAARRGDRYAKRVVNDYIRSLGEGIANIVNLLRPQIIILGGGVSNEGDALIQPVKRYVYRNILASCIYAPLEIVRASLGNDAGMYGAAAYAMDRT